MKPLKIALIEDEIELLEATQTLLELAGFDVDSFRTYEDFIYRFDTLQSDLILSDLNLPGGDGIELVRSVRKKDKIIPIILISGGKTTENEVEAIKSGANDFIAKPFDFSVLSAKIENFLNYRSASVINSIQVDAKSLIVSNGKENVRLTKTELDIFQKLYKQIKSTVHRENLIEVSKINSLDVHIFSLRKKLNPLGLKIETVKGIGYILVA